MNDVFHHAVDVGKIGSTTGGGWCADADEGNVGVLQCVSRPDRGTERAGGDRMRDQVLQPRLDHGTLTRRNGRHLHFVRVDSPDVVAVRSKARGGDGADIAETEDCDLHAFGNGSRGTSPTA